MAAAINFKVIWRHHFSHQQGAPPRTSNKAAWYNCPSKGGCRASGEPLGIRWYNNRSAVIIPHFYPMRTHTLFPVLSVT